MTTRWQSTGRDSSKRTPAGVARQFRLVLLSLLMLLLGSCAEPPQETPGAILTQPTPIFTQTTSDHDAMCPKYASELWNQAELVVIGRFLDVAPEVRAYEGFEYLAYQVEVAAVLRGKNPGDWMTVELRHGRYTDDEGMRKVALSRGYLQPDADSYKLLFLTTRETGHYSHLSPVCWFTTDALDDPASADWRTLSFHPTSRDGEGTILHMDLLDPGGTACRPELTGEELLALRALQGEQETVLRPIDQLPYPTEPLTNMEIDFWGSNQLSACWDISDLVVLGYFLDEPPLSVNHDTGLSEDRRTYYELMVYPFQVVAVLKGETSQEQILAGIIHGYWGGGVSYTFDEMRYPDANSYKVLFLEEEGSERAVYHNLGYSWLSTLPTNEPLAEMDWQNATFTAQGRLSWVSEGVMYYGIGEDPRTPPTGAQLLAYAEQYCYIDQLPYAEDTDGTKQMETDVDEASADAPHLSDLWELSDWVVVGYYENVAPTAETFVLEPPDGTERCDGVYHETLVYQFRVVAVLKGELEEETIPLGQFHGVTDGARSYPAETFLQPDLDSYKIMFLTRLDDRDYYRPVTNQWWLSTEHNLTDLADAGWTALTFRVEDTLDEAASHAFDLFEDGAISVLEAASANMATEDIRTSCTGAELAAYAAQAADE